MSFLNHLEKIYAVENAKFFSDFDISQLQYAADLYLKESSDEYASIQIPESKKAYDEMIGKMINNLSSVNIDKKTVLEFLSVKEDYERLPFSSHDITSITPLQINVRYFEEFIMEIKETIDDILAGDDVSPSNISNITGSNIPTVIEKQSIRGNGISNSLYGMDVKILTKDVNKEMVKVDTNFVKGKVIPFLSSYEEIKKTTINEATLIQKTIRSAIDNIDLLYKALYNYAFSNNEAGKELISKVSAIAYNGCRNAYEIMSFMAFMVIRKMVALMNNIIICNRLYNDVYNFYASESAVVSTVLPLDPNSLADDLVRGNYNAFTDVTKKITEFYTEIPSMEYYGKIMNEVLDNHDPFEKTEYTQTEADKLYGDVHASIMTISNGVDVLYNILGEQLLVIDEVKQQAGFGVPLLDRFDDVIEEIKDTSYYKNAASAYTFGNKDDLDSITNMVGEIARFDNRMYYIAKRISTTFKKIHDIKLQIENNINDEFKHTEFIADLISFIDILSEEYNEFVKELAKNLMNRLLSINEILSSIETNGKTPVSIGVTEDVDFTESAYDELITSIEESTVEKCSEIERTLHAKVVYQERGEKVVYEADAQNANAGTQPTVQQQGNTSQNTTTTTQTNQTDNTKVTVQDGDNQNGNSGGKSTASKIGEWIKNTVNKFLEFIGKQGKKNTEWLNANKEGLTNRSYNNVTVNILPYRNIQPSTITQDIKKLSNNVKALNAQTLNGVKDKNVLYGKLFSFIPGGVKDGETSLKDQFTKYYKVGRGELQVIPISNGELKTEITNTIIPYCESFYSTFSNEIDTNLKELSQAVDNMQDGYAKANVGDKGKWISEAVKMYSGSILNAIRDRNYDYFKVLSSLAPAAPVKPAENNNGKNNNNNNQNNENQENG